MSTQSNTKISFLTVALIFCASIGGIIYGYDLGVFSGVMPIIKDQFLLNDTELGLLGGAIFLGGIFGAIATGYLSDRFGRKQMIIAAAIIFLVGLTFLLIFPGFYQLLIVRFIFGIGVGIIQVAVPTYISEMAPDSIRGRAVVFFELFITVGILIAYLIDLSFTSSRNWELMYGFIAVPCIVLAIMMCYMPQSTRWLALHAAKQATTSAAKKSKLALLGESQSKWSDLLNIKYRHTVLVILAVAILNQLTAINAFLQYAPTIFQKSGLLSASTGLQASLILGVTNIIGTTFALLLVDKIGRKLLLKIGTAGVTIAYIFLAIATGLNLAPVLSVIGLTAFILFFACGPGAIVWLILSELLPTEVRAKGVAIGLFVNSLASWLVSTVFLDIQDVLGLSGTYILFAIFTAIYFWVALKYVPEAKGKSLE